MYRGARGWELTWKAAFPSPLTGFVTVQNYNPDKTVSRRVVAKTINGGNSWRELPVIDDHAWRAFGVGFVDERYGWIGGTTTGLETRDGGRSWAPVDLGRAVNKIRVLRSGSGVHVHAIGTELRRLDLPTA